MLFSLPQVCSTCQGSQDSEATCVSIDCPVVFRRLTARQDLVRADALKAVMDTSLDF